MVYPKQDSDSSVCTGAWVIHSSCSCCHGYCKREAFGEAYNLTHGNCTLGNVCCTSGQSPIQWTPYCAAADMPFTVNCSYRSDNCTLTTSSVYCTCQRNFERATKCDETICPPCYHSYYIALTALLPLVVILVYGIQKYSMYRSKRRRITDDSEEATEEATIIYVKCNILLVVGDRDELKVIADQLEAAMESLARTTNLLKLTRIGIFRLYVDNYSIECDKAIFLLDLITQSTDSRLNHCKDKIRFTKGQSGSVSIVYMDKTDKNPHKIEQRDHAIDQQPNNTVQSDHAFSFESPRRVSNFDEVSAIQERINAYEISLASHPREIGKWLPFVTRITFSIDRRRNCIENMFRQRVYSLRILFKGNETTQKLRQLLHDVLTSCGAKEAGTEERINCNIYVVDSFRGERIWSEIKGVQNVHMFSAANIRPGSDKHQYITASLYCKDEMITGIYEVLHILRVIK